MKTLPSYFLIIYFFITIPTASALSVENMDESLFNNCSVTTKQTLDELDKRLIDIDKEMMQQVSSIDKQTKAINIRSEALVKSFKDLYTFIDKKDLVKYKSSIFTKQKSVNAENDKLLTDLTQIQKKFKDIEKSLANVYCSVVSSLNHYETIETSHENTGKSLTSLLKEFNSKKEKFEGIISEFDDFYGVLSSYMTEIKHSTKFLNIFMANIIIYENNSCHASKAKKICYFPDSEIAPLPSQQVILTKVNEKFLEAKITLKNQALGWSGAKKGKTS